MLLDRADALASKIRSFQALKSAGEEAAGFATRARQFVNVSEKVAGLRAILTSLSTAGVTVDFLPSDGAGYASKARQLRELVTLDPTKIDTAPFNIKHEFLDRLTAMVTAGEKAAGKAWSDYVAKRAAFGADDVLGALAAVPQLRSNVLHIRQIRARVAAFGTDLPNDPKSTIATIDALVAEHEAAWEGLEASAVPASVVSFIREAANQGAQLADYTPEVKAWLESRDLLNAFRIKFG
jgi:hypothetical protein